MNHRHLSATCGGFLLGCVCGATVEVLFPRSGLRSAITLMLINGAAVGAVALVVSLVTARRPPPPPP